MENLNNKLSRCTLGTASLITKDNGTYIKYKLYVSGTGIKSYYITSVLIPVESRKEIELFCNKYSDYYSIPTTIKIFVHYDNQKHINVTYDECNQIFQICSDTNNYTDFFKYLQDWTPAEGTVIVPFEGYVIWSCSISVNFGLYPETSGYNPILYNFITQFVEFNKGRFSETIGSYIHGNISKYCKYSIDMYTGYQPKTFPLDVYLKSYFSKEFLSRGGGTLADKYSRLINEKGYEAYDKLVYDKLRKICRSWSDSYIRNSFLQFIEGRC